MFHPGQRVRFTSEGAKKYRQSPFDVMFFERSRPIDSNATVYMALVRYEDGSEAVYEEAYLEAV